MDIYPSLAIILLMITEFSTCAILQYPFWHCLRASCAPRFGLKPFVCFFIVNFHSHTKKIVEVLICFWWLINDFILYIAFCFRDNMQIIRPCIFSQQLWEFWFILVSFIKLFHSPNILWWISSNSRFFTQYIFRQSLHSRLAPTIYINLFWNILTNRQI